MLERKKIPQTLVISGFTTALLIHFLIQGFNKLPGWLGLIDLVPIVIIFISLLFFKKLTEETTPNENETAPVEEATPVPQEHLLLRDKLVAISNKVNSYKFIVFILIITFITAFMYTKTDRKPYQILIQVISLFIFLTLALFKFNWKVKTKKEILLILSVFLTFIVLIIVVGIIKFIN